MEDFLTCSHCQKLLRPAFQGERTREASPRCPACFEEMIRLDRAEGGRFEVYHVEGVFYYTNLCGTFLLCEAAHPESKLFTTIPLQKTLTLDEAGHDEFCDH